MRKNLSMALLIMFHQPLITCFTLIILNTMSGFGHPTTQESLRNFPVTPSEFERVLGHRACTITSLDWLQFKVGERVNVCNMAYQGTVFKKMFCARYIVAIRPVLALMSDENLMEYDLNVFNESEL